MTQSPAIFSASLPHGSLTDEDLAKATPMGLAWYHSRGLWQYAPHLNLLNTVMMRVASRQIRRLMVSMPPRHGKALALDTPIATPDGWTTIVELKVGDTVFAADGAPCQVIGVSPIWRDRPVYEVTTDDGDRIVADEQHEWVARLDGKRPRFKRHTTKVLARHRQKSAMIMRQAPLQLPSADLPVDPYVLGLWLGDGCSRHATIVAGDEDREVLRSSVETSGYTTIDRADRKSFGIRGLQAKLRALGVLGNKHVPEIYLRSSIEQRQALLQGLVDTDGYVAPDGQVEFCSTTRALAEAVRELVYSLGRKASCLTGRAMIDGKDCGRKYRVMFYYQHAARLPRKAKRCRDGVKTPHRYVTARPIGTADTVCIEVNSPSHMFLAGRSMVPTHNSEFLSKYVPAWWCMRFQQRRPRVILASYEADWAATWGEKARNVVEEVGGPLFGVRLFDRAAHHWSILPIGARDSEEPCGTMWTAGVGGPITGKGADLFIIDDPIKNHKEALSQVMRDHAYDWYCSTARTRLEPGGVMVIVATRWHEDDLIGRLMRQAKESGERWTVINLPALCEREENPLERELGRKQGEALWPVRYDVAALQEIKKGSSFWWSAIYQGRPSPPEGNLFRRQWFQYVERLVVHEDMGPEVFYLLRGVNREKRVAAKDCWTFGIVDPAASLKTSADFFVFSTFAVTPDFDLLWLNCLRARLSGPEQVKTISNLYVRFQHAFVGIEAVGYQLTLVQDIQALGVPVQRIDADKDKVSRAIPASVRYEAGQVYHLLGADWLDEVETELLNFPNAEHDDVVDTVSYAAKAVSIYSVPMIKSM
jgi:predicted phage terminase large subunit-like protein